MNISKKPLVSVIVPVYNVEGYLDECLNSIKQQTYTNLEILLIEDCSTDRSMTVLQAHLTDTRFKLIPHHKNSGISAARNTGIEAATGDYLMFVDSDDIIDTRLVATCVNCAETTDADLITYGFTRFSDGIDPIEQLDFPNDPALIENKVGDEYFSLENFAWLKFIRSKVLQASDTRFLENLYYEDWPFHWHGGLSIKNRYQ
uniref:glycosyltransferase family 2 protein n=1 Tax=Psychrobacter immobilis TaxID=498 RepID=UPI001918D78F